MRHLSRPIRVEKSNDDNVLAKVGEHADLGVCFHGSVHMNHGFKDVSEVCWVVQTNCVLYIDQWVSCDIESGHDAYYHIFYLASKPRRYLWVLTNLTEIGAPPSERQENVFVSVGIGVNNSAICQNNLWIDNSSVILMKTGWEKSLPRS